MDPHNFIPDAVALSEKGKEYFHRLALTAKRMKLLIEDLLIYAGTKSSDRKFEKTDLKIIIDEVKKDLDEIISEKQAMIDVSGLGNARVICFQFNQLFHNLIGNPVKFSKPGVMLRIKIKSEIIKMTLPANDKLKPKTDYCHITYTDNGIGFLPQYNFRIFEVFQRLHSREKYSGTGIGLAICKRIIENHQGNITAAGKFTRRARFDVYIPA